MARARVVVVGGGGLRGGGGSCCCYHHLQHLEGRASRVPPRRRRLPLLVLLALVTFIGLSLTLPGVDANDRHKGSEKDKRALTPCQQSRLMNYDNKKEKPKGPHNFFKLGGNVTMTSIVNTILSSDTYDSHIRPGVDAGTPTIVYLNIFVNSISSIDDFNMEYAMTFYLRQRWQDPRLSYKGLNKTVTLNYNDIHRIWVPDLFFRNEKAGMLHDITVPNRLLRLWPDGSVLYSQRISLRLDCMMQLQKYPLDDQKCRMEIGSYGYTTNDLVFKWLETGAPLSMKENLELPEFSITGTKVGDCTRVFSTGSFACVYAEFHFDRKFEFYLLQTYIPSFLIVVLSWVSFWIDINAVPARISLGLLTVLTMTTQSSAISARLPRVSYIKAIDVWMAVCLVFVFSALIEYSAVNVLYRKTKSKDKRRHRLEDCPELTRRNDLDDGKVEMAGDAGPEAPLRERHTVALCKHCGKDGEYNDRKFQKNISFCQKSNRNQAIIVDTTSRFLFPTAFMVFNFAYWLLYASIL